MKGSLRIARIFGIDVAIHWTFLFLIAYVLYFAAEHQAGPASTLIAGLFVGLIFLCVVAHEFGHALTARAFGIQTRHITLLPIGGVAALERMPTDPVQELLVAVAGPAVNVVIAAVLAAFIVLFGDIQTAVNPFTQTDTLLRSLAVVNIALVVFNMLPAFPMDGGRVLRAVLAFGLDHAQATRIAARVGQVMAGVFLLVGLALGSPLLMLIAVFVFLGGQAEANAATQRSAIADASVADGMVTDIRTLSQAETLADAAEALLDTSQHDFPVLDDAGRFLGLLTRDGLVQALASTGPSTRAIEAARTDLPRIEPGASLAEVLDQLREFGPALPVCEGDRLVGLLTMENVSELLMLREAASMRRARRG